MARMIPPVISPEVKSNAERHVFLWFQNAPGTDDWIVLHSLGITNHNKVIHGEVDFFVLAPGLGIFSIEVKGGRVSRKDGIWTFTDKYDHTDSKIRGPFDQAWEGIYSIRQSYSEKLDTQHEHLKNILFGIGVMFPDIEYSAVGADEAQWQVFDCNNGKSVCDFIKRLSEGAKNTWRILGKVVEDRNLPTVEDVQYIAQYLRGDFDKTVCLRKKMDYISEELIALTKEQYRCIDQLQDNARCFISGGAGTGKTLIALEAVKNAVARNEKVALFCYNSRLGEWLEEYFSMQSANLRPFYVGTLHKFMFNVLKKGEISPEMPSNEKDIHRFYSKVIPTYAETVLGSLDYKFDRIIVDEAQDLIGEDYLRVINSCLQNGIDRGKWTLFGDFSMQNIYNNTYERDIQHLEEIASFTRFRLTVNCRNTKKICNEIYTITGANTNCTRHHSVEGIAVEYLTYASSEEAKGKLINVISKLRENHIEDGQITILSPRKRDNSVISKLSGIEIKDYSVNERNKITFSTIQSFKGLENTVIILTDIENYSDTQLMYVGLSRARSGLYILESEKAEKQYAKLYIERRCQNGRCT